MKEIYAVINENGNDIIGQVEFLFQNKNMARGYAEVMNNHYGTQRYRVQTLHLLDA